MQKDFLRVLNKGKNMASFSLQKISRKRKIPGLLPAALPKSQQWRSLDLLNSDWIPFSIFDLRFISISPWLPGRRRCWRGGGQPKRRSFMEFSFRGVDLDQLLDMSTDELFKLFHARARRKQVSRALVLLLVLDPSRIWLGLGSLRWINVRFYFCFGPGFSEVWSDIRWHW